MDDTDGVVVAEDGIRSSQRKVGRHEQRLRSASSSKIKLQKDDGCVIKRHREKEHALEILDRVNIESVEATAPDIQRVTCL